MSITTKKRDLPTEETTTDTEKSTTAETETNKDAHKPTQILKDTPTETNAQKNTETKSDETQSYMDMLGTYFAEDTENVVEATEKVYLAPKVKKPRVRPNVIPEELWKEVYGNRSEEDVHSHKLKLQTQAQKVVCVQNIHENANESDIRMAFGEYFGADAVDTRAARAITHIQVVRDTHTHKCLGYAFVEFNTHQVAKQAIQVFQGMKMPGHAVPLCLTWAKTCTTASLDAYQLYIGNLTSDVDNNALLEYARSFSAALLSAKLIIDPTTNVSRGYGFLRYETGHDATEALDKMRRIKKTLGQHLPVVRTVCKQPPASDFKETGITNTCLFIANLSPLVTKEELEGLFLPFGPIVSARVASMRNFGFVTFHDHISALAAITHMPGVEYKGHKLACAWGRQRHELPYHIRIESSKDHQHMLEDLTYSYEWHNSMQPQAHTQTEAPLPKEQLDAKDEAYWLSFLANPVVAPNHTS